LAPDAAERIAIDSDADVVTARQRARQLAVSLDMPSTDQTLLATAISEIARNIVVHVGEGEIILRPLDDGQRCGVMVIARDAGPGIRDVEAAVQQGYADSASLGLGLPGARRLMDEFDLASSPETGTTVTMVKWRIRDDLEMLRERRARR
jgi:serine/threonine-protein kinase RsbT